MIKQEEISDPSSCLNQAQEDEPLFVLKANDPLAPEIVGYWIARSEAEGLHTARIPEATRCALSMLAWKKRQQEES